MAHSVSLRAGGTAAGVLTLAEHVIEKSYRPDGALTLTLKFCSEVTSKRHGGHPIQVAVLLRHSAVPQPYHTFALTQAVPWLSRPPRSATIEIVQDGPLGPDARPGKR